MYEKFPLQQEETVDESIAIPSSLAFNPNAVFVRKLGNALVLLPADARWEIFFKVFSSFQAISCKIVSSLKKRNDM